MLSVIGVGFPRTGTMSLKLALEQLGFGPCYHMIEVFQRPDDVPLWRAAAAGEPNWDRLFSGFRSTSDAPACIFWRKLIAQYPDARVVLTTRNPDLWYESFRETAYQAITHPERAPDEQHLAVQEMARELILERLLEGCFEDRQRAISIYREHNKAIRQEVDPARLLVFDVLDGWEPLCGFLNVTPPPEPFPHINTRGEFRERFHIE